MIRNRRGIAVGGAIAAGVLVLAGCSSDGGGSEGTMGGSYSIAIEEIESLMPTNCWDLYCSQVLSALYTGLYDVSAGDDESYKATPSELNESVTTSDGGTIWTIKIKSGFKFTDGEVVTAKSFVDTWNYAANGGNGQQLGAVLGPDQLNVAGWDKVSGEKTTGKTLSGLKVVDDTSFEVTLAAPLGEEAVTNFLSGPQIYPVPSAGLASAESFDKAPIGNGPYKIAADQTVKAQSIKVVRNADYAGTAGMADSVEFKTYPDSNAKWVDLQSNALDPAPELPSNTLSSADSVLGERFINEPGAWSYSAYGFSPKSLVFKERNVRVAFAKAINWNEINDKIWFNTRSTASSFAPATMPGGGTDICGDSCTFDAAKAQQLLKDAGGWPGGTVQIAALSSDDQATQKAVCNQIQTNLSIECSLKEFANFGEYLDFIGGDSVPDDFVYALSWAGDNPTIANMVSQFDSESYLNDLGYKNEQFDTLIQEGNAAQDSGEQISKWQEAEKVLLDDFAAYPYQMRNTAAGYSNRIDNVVVNPMGQINIPEITVKQ